MAIYDIECIGGGSGGSGNEGGDDDVMNIGEAMVKHFLLGVGLGSLSGLGVGMTIMWVLVG